MFGEETKALGENYLAERIAYRCAQHDQFITNMNSVEELHRLEEAQRRMIIKLRDKFDFNIQMDKNLSTQSSGRRSQRSKMSSVDQNKSKRRQSIGENEKYQLQKLNEIENQLQKSKKSNVINSPNARSEKSPKGHGAVN